MAAAPSPLRHSLLQARALWLLLLGVGSRASTGYTCPNYADIRQPSVEASVFDIRDFAGTWYMIATNEPTQPSLCTCSVNVVEVHEDDVDTPWYAYTNTANCGGKNVSLPVKGLLSEDPDSPGLLRENFGAANHTMRRLDPNMVFQASYVGSSMDTAFTYACLGRLPVPPFGSPKFSFNLLSRSPRWNASDIQSLIADANATTGGVLDVEGMRISDEADYASCGMLAAATTSRRSR